MSIMKVLSHFEKNKDHGYYDVESFYENLDEEVSQQVICFCKKF